MKRSLKTYMDLHITIFVVVNVKYITVIVYISVPLNTLRRQMPFRLCVCHCFTTQRLLPSLCSVNAKGKVRHRKIILLSGAHIRLIRRLFFLSFVVVFSKIGMRTQFNLCIKMCTLLFSCMVSRAHVSLSFVLFCVCVLYTPVMKFGGILESVVHLSVCPSVKPLPKRYLLND